MELKLTTQQAAELTHSLKRFFAAEFDQELTDLKARLVLNYVAAEIAPLAYNQGVKDAETYFRQAVEDVTGTCFEPEMTYWQKKRS